MHKVIELCEEEDRPALLDMVEEARQAVKTLPSGLTAMAQEQGGEEADEVAEPEAPSSPQAQV